MGSAGLASPLAPTVGACHTFQSEEARAAWDSAGTRKFSLGRRAGVFLLWSLSLAPGWKFSTLRHTRSLFKAFIQIQTLQSQRVSISLLTSNNQDTQPTRQGDLGLFSPKPPSNGHG